MRGAYTAYEDDLITVGYDDAPSQALNTNRGRVTGVVRLIYSRMFPFLAPAATLVTISKHCGTIINPPKAAIVRGVAHRRSRHTAVIYVPLQRSIAHTSGVAKHETRSHPQSVASDTSTHRSLSLIHI